MRSDLVALLALALWSLGCSDRSGSSADPVEERPPVPKITTAALLDVYVNDVPGVKVTNPSLRHDGIGVLSPGPCTATFVRPNVVLTAAHCVRFGQRGAASYRIDAAGRRHDGTCVHSFTTGHYDDERAGWVPDDENNDIALLRVVPETQAARFAIEESRPTHQEEVEFIGAGCRNHDQQMGQRHVATGPWTRLAEGDLVCDGDSGGPLLRRRTSVVGIASGYVRHAPSHYAWMRADVAAKADELQEGCAEDHED
ncbi:MAG: trypsin-like serine protease [Sandaracinaceae bacterium]